MTETKITLTLGDTNQYTTLCSGALGCTSSTFGMPIYTSIDSNPDDAHIRRIVAEEVAKSEERITEMVIRKIKLQAGTRV